MEQLISINIPAFRLRGLSAASMHLAQLQHFDQMWSENHNNRGLR